MSKRHWRFLAVCLLAVGAAIAGAQPAEAQPANPADYLDLPAGVIHVALPPGTLKIEHTVKNGKPLLRVSVGQTVVVAQTVFFGDGKHATQYEARKNGICWLSVAKPGQGFTVSGRMTNEPGSSTILQFGDYLKVGQLTPGSIYLTTPSVNFIFEPGPKP